MISNHLSKSEKNAGMRALTSKEKLFRTTNEPKHDFSVVGVSVAERPSGVGVDVV